MQLPAETSRKTAMERRITATGDSGRGVVPLMLVVIVAAVLAAWSNALEAAFVLDDVVQIVERQRRLVEWWPLSESLRYEQRPLTYFTLVIDHAMWPSDPWGFHLTNILLHAAAAGLLFLAVREAARRLGTAGSDWIAFATALLWSLHPVQTSAATYVIQRAEILLAIGAFLAAWCLLRSMREGAGVLWRVLVPLAVLLSMLSKPTAVAVPPILLLLDWTVSGDAPRNLLRRRGVVHAMNFAAILLIIPLGVLPGLFETGDGPTGAGLGVAGTTPTDYARMQVTAIGLYTSLAFWPDALSIDHGRSALDSRSLDLLGWLVIAVAAGSSILGVMLRRWWALPGAVLLISLAPTSSIVPLADPVAEHRMYLAGLSFVIVAVAATAWLARRFGNAVPAGRHAIAAAMIALLAGVAVAEGVRTRQRNLDYIAPERLWEEVLARRPDDRRALLNRSHALIAQDRHEEARADLERLLGDSSGDVLAGLNLAILELRLGNPDEALPHIDRAVSAYPLLVVARSARGDALAMLGRHTEAIVEYEIATRRQPSNPMIRLALGNALAEDGRLDEAVSSFEIAARLADRSGNRPLAASAHFNAGNMHFVAERYERAGASYAQALARDPDHAEAARWRSEASRYAAEQAGSSP